MEDEGSQEEKVGSPCRGEGEGWRGEVQIVLWLRKTLLKMQVGLVDMTELRRGTRGWRWGWGGR